MASRSSAFQKPVVVLYSRANGSQGLPAAPSSMMSGQASPVAHLGSILQNRFNKIHVKKSFFTRSVLQNRFYKIRFTKLRFNRKLFGSIFTHKFWTNFHPKSHMYIPYKFI
jgi:hypothetical protein